MIPAFEAGGMGSSPHARGKHGGDLRIAGGSRLIPACAGKTPKPCGSRSQQTAHPRMRGENESTYCLFAAWSGSSPHARGKRPSQYQKCAPLGLIPACTGKTAGVVEKTPRPGAHPRMRGENGIRSSRLLRARGSSPHARGKPARAKAAEAMRGSSPHARGKLLKAGGASMIGWLIPACAGKTLFAVETYRVGWAHPRMRGENCGVGAEGR